MIYFKSILNILSIILKLINLIFSYRKNANISIIDTHEKILPFEHEKITQPKDIDHPMR